MLVAKTKKEKDISRKLCKEDILILHELQTALLRRDIRMNQKELIDHSIKFAANRKGEFFDFIPHTHTKDNTRQHIGLFLDEPKKDFGKKFLEEIDTTQ